MPEFSCHHKRVHQERIVVKVEAREIAPYSVQGLCTKEPGVRHSVSIVVCESCIDDRLLKTRMGAVSAGDDGIPSRAQKAQLPVVIFFIVILSRDRKIRAGRLQDSQQARDSRWVAPIVLFLNQEVR
jgi:hypothetical protein